MCEPHLSGVFRIKHFVRDDVFMSKNSNKMAGISKIKAEQICNWVF